MGVVSCMLASGVHSRHKTQGYLVTVASIKALNSG
jgi:hypothetical protein